MGIIDTAVCTRKLMAFAEDWLGRAGRSKAAVAATDQNIWGATGAALEDAASGTGQYRDNFWAAGFFRGCSRKRSADSSTPLACSHASPLPTLLPSL